MAYYVYVIRLDDSVSQSGKFRRLNPDMKPGAPCFYVGQSCHHPEIRFWQHKKGVKSNRFAQTFGLGLCPQFYDRFNPMINRTEAETREKMIADDLRKRGFGVWSH